MNNGWRSVRLRDVARLINGRAYKKAELLGGGKYPVLRVGNFFTNQSWYYSDLELEEDKYCDSGDLLYAWSASFGPRIWTGRKVIFHYHIWKVDYDPGQVDKRFLFYWFEWDKEKIKQQQGAGTTMIHVTKGSMEKRVLKLPTISEQKRIVAILDEAFAGIETAIANTEKNLANAREIFASYLNTALCPQGGSWERVCLSDVCSITSGLVDPRDPQYADLPHVGAGNMASRTGQLSNVLTAHEEGLKSGKYLFDRSMVLYSKIRPYLEKVARPNPDLFTTLPTAAPSGPRLRRFARSRILTGQTSTPAVRSVAKRHSHWA